MFSGQLAARLPLFTPHMKCHQATKQQRSKENVNANFTRLTCRFTILEARLPGSRVYGKPINFNSSVLICVKLNPAM